MPPSAEDRVRQLAKQNTTCPNCHQTKKFGFGTICIKFHTFVCNECKTSHQAVSHRCKSITMSSWTQEEVDELERKGNAYCESTWLAKAPPVGQGGRPTAGSSIDVFKRFVVDAYEHKRYFSDQQQPVASAPVPTASASQFASVSHQNLPASPTAAMSFAKAPVVAPPQPVADLFDFASFDAAPAPPPAVPTVDPFTPAPPSAVQNGNHPASFDMFADFASANTTTTAPAAANNTSSSFAFLNGSNTTTSNSNGMNNYGGTDFATTTNNNKKPIMNTGTMNGISSMPLMTSNSNNMMSTGMYPAPMMMQGSNDMGNGMMQHQPMSFMNNMNTMNNTNMKNGMGGGMIYNPNNMMQAPVMSYHGGSTAISNMNNNMQQKQQKQKDAFSDLLPF